MSEKLICLHSWAPIRKEPSSASEMVHSLLFGEIVWVRKEINDSWLEVQTVSPEYVGFIPEDYLSELPKEQFSVKTIFEVSYIQSLQNPQYKIRISPGSFLPDLSSITIGGIEYSTQIMATQKIDEFTFLRQFLNTPYLWGGRSIWGIDCSGLSGVFARIQGAELPRDACDQCEFIQKEISWGQHRKGDLAFFSNEKGKVTHVGVILEDNKIIHAHNRVCEDELSVKGIIKPSNELSHKLSSIKRIEL